jgi:chemotaxis protein MotB
MSEPKLSDLDEIAQTDARGAWLLTYADLVTLILVFFILLFSLSKMELGNITDTLKSFEISIGAEEPKTSLFDIIKTGSPGGRKMLDQLIGMREVDVFKEIESFISRRGLNDNVEAELREGRIVLRVEGRVLFNSGSADLLPQATYILSDIVEIINNSPHYDIDIQGHTDNHPITTAKFASNWELSAIRATTVLRYLIEDGVFQERLTATGFADLRPVASNDTPEGRRKNRRVEFVLKEKQ